MRHESPSGNLATGAVGDFERDRDMMLRPCSAPLGTSHEVFERDFGRIYDNPASSCSVHGPTDPSARLVWFIEKCRVLETEKLQLVSRLAEVEATSGKVSARIDTMKQGNKALKTLSAELAAKLRQAQKELQQRSEKEVAADKSRAEVDEEVRRLTADRKRLLSQNRHISQRHTALQLELDQARRRCNELTEQLRTAQHSTVERDERSALEIQDVVSQAGAQESSLRSVVVELQRERDSLHIRNAQLQERLAAAISAKERLVVEQEGKEQDWIVERERLQSKLEEVQEWAQSRVGTTVALEEELKATREELARASDERYQLDRAVRQLQIQDEQQRALLLDTRQKLQKANHAVMEAQKLTRLEYVATKDFKQNIAKLLREVLQQQSTSPRSQDGVSFVCGACQETVRKPAVDKHVQKCPQCWVLTCVDCSKDFHGEEFRAHSTCISEAEKYQGKLFVASTKGGKKNPQKDFAGCVAEAASRPGVAPAVAAHLTSIAAYDNVPRKKKQFINFCQNSLKLRQPAVLEAIWNAIDAVVQEVNASKAASGDGAGGASAGAGAAAAGAGAAAAGAGAGDGDVEDEIVGEAGEEVVDEPAKKDKKDKKDKKGKKDRKEKSEGNGVVDAVADGEEKAESSKEKKKKKKKRDRAGESVDAGLGDFDIVSALAAVLSKTHTRRLHVDEAVQAVADIAAKDTGCDRAAAATHIAAVVASGALGDRCAVSTRTEVFVQLADVADGAASQQAKKRKKRDADE